MKYLTYLILSCSLCLSVSSCVPVAAGAAAGYLLNEKGYKVRNPLTKDPDVELKVSTIPSGNDSGKTVTGR